MGSALCRARRDGKENRDMRDADSDSDSDDPTPNSPSLSPSPLPSFPSSLSPPVSPRILVNEVDIVNHDMNEHQKEREAGPSPSSPTLLSIPGSSPPITDEKEKTSSLSPSLSPPTTSSTTTTTQQEEQGDTVSPTRNMRKRSIFVGNRPRSLSFGIDIGGTLSKIVLFFPESVVEEEKNVYDRVSTFLSSSDHYGETGQR